jgi:hypothetical protein
MTSLAFEFHTRGVTVAVDKTHTNFLILLMNGRWLSYQSRYPKAFRLDAILDLSCTLSDNNPGRCPTDSRSGSHDESQDLAQTTCQVGPPSRITTSLATLPLPPWCPSSFNCRVGR